MNVPLTRIKKYIHYSELHYFLTIIISLRSTINIDSTSWLSPWLKIRFWIWLSETLQINRILVFAENHFTILLRIMSPWLKRVFQYWFSETLQNDLFYYLLAIIIFTMVEENIENWLSETHALYSTSLVMYTWFHMQPLCLAFKLKFCQNWAIP